MTITTNDINTLANLARLQFPDKDMPTVTERLNDVFALIEHMQSLDTTDITPLANPHDATQRLRDDTTKTEHNQAELLSNAPLVEHGFICVPTVID